MRQLATIQKVKEILPIEGADKIELIKIKDWQCVSEKGNFNVGDLCVYFEIDSLLPLSNPVFGFLAGRTKAKTMNVDGKEHVGYRLKTIRLRGALSQGLALPVDLFRTIGYFQSGMGVHEGKDVSDELHVVKYEAPIPVELSGVMKGNFPSFIPKTDEERIQNIGDVLEKHLGDEFIVTEKLDGSSMTVYMKDGVLGVCSRNLELVESESNTFWKLARKYKLERLPNGFAVQGEAVGEGLQGNPLKLTGQHFYVYNVYNFEKGEYLNYGDMKIFCDIHELKMVPPIDLHFILDQYYMTVDHILELASGATHINVDYDPNGPRKEGVVIRPVIEGREVFRGQEQRFSFKAISNEYLLSEVD